jgi:FdhE protein
MAVANSRWDNLLATHPDLGPAVALQQKLLTLVLEATAALEAGPMPRLSLPPKYLAAKLGRGIPAFAGEPIPVPAARLAGTLRQLCHDLAEGGAGEVATHITAALNDGRIDPGALLTALLARDQTLVRAGATRLGLAPDLVWLVGELAASPIAHLLQRVLFATAPGPDLRQALAGWNHGYCPACGSWPALAEVVRGHRLLRCSFCAAAWELTTYACVYCGEEGEAFVTAAPDTERLNRRLELCSTCGSYLKAVDVEELSPFPLVAIADMETMDLDVAAIEHRYGRPTLREFRKDARP